MILKQLSRLSSNVEGRYATPQELQFVTDFQSSLELRISTYRRIRDAELEIVNLTYEKSCVKEPRFFSQENEYVKSFCIRDAKIVLVSVCLAILTNDLEELKDNLLIWQKTIVKAFDHKICITVFYRIMEEVIQEKLSEEELVLVNPALKLIFHSLSE